LIKKKLFFSLIICESASCFKYPITHTPRITQTKKTHTHTIALALALAESESESRRKNSLGEEEEDADLCEDFDRKDYHPRG
jgi:hypothetical protein